MTLGEVGELLSLGFNAIMGFAELMESEVYGSLGSPRYADYCRDIQQSGTYLLSVIEHVQGAGQFEIDGDGFARRLLGHQRQRGVKGRAEVDVAAHELHPLRLDELAGTLHVLADERALQQILLNIIQNAVKFTPEQGRVALRGRSCNGFVHLFIGDTGIGIPKTAISKLGRPFELGRRHRQAHQHQGADPFLGADAQRPAVQLRGGTGDGEAKAGARLPMPTPERLAEVAREAERDTLQAIGEMTGVARTEGDRIAAL
jgi:two-component system cell cycle sensor histidine kinase PleC